MRPWLLLAVLLARPALAASPERKFSELPPGRYTIVLSGLVTAVCARAIMTEWSKLPEVQFVSADFESSSASVTVRLDSILKVDSLRKGLRRAEKLANLGARYDATRVSYRLDASH